MNNAHTFQRITAYMIDIILISFITVLITMGIPTSQKYKDAEKQSATLIEDYTKNKINEKEYLDKLNETRYIIGKEGIAISLVSVVITFGYFAGFTFYNKGQTLGKKLLHIKLVTKDDKEVSHLQTIARAMIHNSCLTSILSIIFLLFIKSSQYMYTVGVLELVQSIVMISSFIMIICRNDRRGIHDLICGTKVVQC